METGPDALKSALRRVGAAKEASRREYDLLHLAKPLGKRIEETLRLSQEWIDASPGVVERSTDEEAETWRRVTQHLRAIEP